MSNYQVKSVEPVVVGTDIQVRVFTLADGDVIPWHYHSESTDHYFVLRGQLTIETRSSDHRHRLSIGERLKIPPGTAHRISNESTSECQFLLVQGVGRYDWHKADLTQNEKPPIALVSGRSPDWLKMKNLDAPAVKREEEEDWGKGRCVRT